MKKIFSSMVLILFLIMVPFMSDGYSGEGDNKKSPSQSQKAKSDQKQNDNDKDKKDVPPPFSKHFSIMPGPMPEPPSR